MLEETNAIRVLDEAAEMIRKEAGLKRSVHDFGSEAVIGEDGRLVSIADMVASTQPELPPLPRAGVLTTLLIVIFVVALLFLATIYLVRDENLLPTLLVGQGTILAALTGIASYLASIHSASVKAYNERAAEWLRIDAVVRILREMSRGKKFSPEVMVALLDALRAVFPSRPL